MTGAEVTFCDWCGHTANRNPCAACCRRYESARAAVAPTDNDLSATAAEHDGTPVGPERT